MQKATLVFSCLGVVALAGLFWLFRPETPKNVSPQTAQVSPAPTTPYPHNANSQPASPAPQSVAVEIRQGQRTRGPDVIRIAQGSTLTLLLLSDVDGELHLHGYDRHVHLKAGKTVELSFNAEHSGRFEYELHGSGQGAHQALGVIEVLPR